MSSFEVRSVRIDEDARGCAELVSELGYPTDPRQMKVRLLHILAALDAAAFVAEALSDLGECAPLRIGEPKSGRKVSSQDAVLGREVLVLE